MHITRITIENIRSLQKLQWEVPEENLAGWHVILGDNGAGKTAFIRSVAYALVGPEQALALRQDWSKWRRDRTHLGYIEINFLPHEDWDKIVTKPPSVLTLAGKGLKLEDLQKQLLTIRINFPNNVADPGWHDWNSNNKYDPQSDVWREDTGWFSASFGPFRRFTGGDSEYEELLRSRAKVAHHLTAFGEGVALTEALRWLQDLRFKELEKHPEGKLLPQLRDFINSSRLLPHRTTLEEVTSEGVYFRDGNGCRITAQEMSDGYRSILSLTFELIRQLYFTFGLERLFSPEDPTQVIPPGVVLIDEADVHLHPTWQGRLGAWFTQHFPNIQFLVTTHSPILCQSATSIFLLPTPGTEAEGRMLTEIELNRLRYGNILEAYSTGVFGEVGRSIQGEAKLERLAELNIKELRKGLTKREVKEQYQLRSIFATTPHTLDGNSENAK